jgi:hypothetical protein
VRSDRDAGGLLLQAGLPHRAAPRGGQDDDGKRITFLTNNTRLAPETIGELYRLRWQVELFFKWIKQHLRIKAFFGTSENAVKTQIWIAVATYVLIAIVKKRAMLPHSLYELLQILSLTMFETTPINQLLAPPPPCRMTTNNSFSSERRWDTTDLKRKLMRYIRQYNKQPKTVKWKYFDPSRRISSESVVTVH